MFVPALRTGKVFEVWVSLQVALLLSLAANLVTLNRQVTLDPVS